MNFLWGLHIIFSILTLATGIWEVVEETKKKKKFEISFIIILLLVCFIPFINIGLMYVGLMELVPEYLKKNKPIKEKKKKQKELKRIQKQDKILLQKHPEKVTVQTISKILKVYTEELEYVTRFQNTLNALRNINQYLVENNEKPEIINLLIEYELTFTRMLTIIEDSVDSDKESFYEVINVANETIYLFNTEIQKIKDDEYELEKIISEKTKERRIQELREDQEFHKKKNATIS